MLQKAKCFNNVNYLSIIAIFVIIMIILVSVIEFAIFINMSVPYYSNYHKERLRGAGKSEAVSSAYNAILYKRTVQLNELKEKLYPLDT